MVMLSNLIQGYCQALSIAESKLICPKRTADIIQIRLKLTALVIKQYFPQCLDSLVLNNPSELLKILLEVLGTSKSSVSKLANNARFYYRTYSDFRNQVDQLEKQILNAA